MLLDYHSFYGDVTPATPSTVWVPVPVPARVRPRQRTEPDKVIVRGRLDAELPPAGVHARAHVVPVPQLHARSDAWLQPLQQQAQATTSVGVEMRAGLPSMHALGVSGVSQHGAARLPLDAMVTAGSAQLRTTGTSDVSLRAAETAAVGTARLTASMTGPMPELVTRVAVTASYRLPTKTRIEPDDWTDDALLAAAQILLDEEEED